MGHSACVDISAFVTTELQSPDGKQAIIALLTDGVEGRSLVEHLAGRTDANMAELLMREIEELPQTLVQTIQQAWEMATAGGREFALVSTPPDRPLEFARNQRVRVTVDVEADRVVVALSHVPGRHAAWYQEAALSR